MGCYTDIIIIDDHELFISRCPTLSRLIEPDNIPFPLNYLPSAFLVFKFNNILFDGAEWLVFDDICYRLQQRQES